HSMLEQSQKDEKGQPIYKEIATRGTISSKEDPRELILNPQVSPWDKLYKRKLLMDNNIRFPEGVIYEDTSFYIKTIPFIKKQSYLDEKLVYYTVRQKSTMTSNLGRRVGDIFKVMKDILKFYKENNLYDKYKDELEFFCVKIAFCSNLSRIGRVNDRGIRRELLDDTFTFVQKNFPQYKSNKYFKGKIGLYIKSVNRINCGLYAKILSKVMIG
ncbi:MAG: glycosyl transferase family 2, partial [Butyrivibrio sp.]|nr:glycosyl transferase family 2 [Butyrivibrio sp.]